MKVASILCNWAVGFACVLIGLSACSANRDLEQSLVALRDSLKTTNDTIAFYSLKDKYAIWIHLDEPPMYESGLGVQSLYSYDLETQVRTKILTTKKDSLYLLPDRTKVVLEGIDVVSPSNDSLAILIADKYERGSVEGRAYMLPFNKTDTLYLLDWYPDLEQGGASYAAGEGKYYVKEKNINLPPEVENLGGVGPWTAEQTHIYTTSGTYVSTEEKAALMSAAEEDQITVPIQTLKHIAELKRIMIGHIAYKIEDLYQAANNVVSFKERFSDAENLQYYALTVNSVQEIPDMDRRDSNGNYGKRLRVDGDDFCIYTTDRQFVNLHYPCQIIIRAQANDVQRALNTSVGSIFSLLGDELGLNTDVRFSFTRAQLLYKAD